MPIASSTLELEHEQADGSRWCTEVHQFEDGSVQRFYYLLAPDDNAQAIMEERAAALDAAEDEG